MQISGINNNFDNIDFKAVKPVVVKRFKETSKELSMRLLNKENDMLKLEESILHKLLKGFSITEISEKLGVSKYRVNEISAKYNAHKIYIERRNEVILEKLISGISRKTIMKEMDVSKRTVQMIAEPNNVFKENVQKRDALILEKIKDGCSTNDIAKELGIHVATVWRTVKKFGISLREFKKNLKN